MKMYHSALRFHSAKADAGCHAFAGRIEGLRTVVGTAKACRPADTRPPCPQQIPGDRKRLAMIRALRRDARLKWSTREWGKSAAGMLSRCRWQHGGNLNYPRKHGTRAPPMQRVAQTFLSVPCSPRQECLGHSSE